jgi:peptide chain release factor 1
LKELYNKKSILERKIINSLLIREKEDEKNAIVEIRAGTGGDEATLFAKDLFRMYTKFIEKKGWKMEVMSSHPSDIGGFKEIIFLVKGEGAYGVLRFESGVHRVQRIPITESGGRIHTSAATVAVLPELEDFELKIEEKDIKMEFYNASGPGGQNVNKVATAVRLTHIPTGIVVTCQDERSQFQNRLRAMSILRSKLFQIEKEKREKEIGAIRKNQIGTGDRSEKIRTYNFPQNRLTDHRINFTSYDLESFLEGELDELIENLQISLRSKGED